MKHGRTVRVATACARTLSLLVFLCRSAHGQAAHRVRVEAPENTPLAHRLVSELQSSGFAVETREWSSLGTPLLGSSASLEAVARVSAKTIRVWWVRDGALVPEPPGATTADAATDDPWLPVVRAAELIRARLLPVLPPPSTPGGPPDPSDPSDGASTPATLGTSVGVASDTSLPALPPPTAASVAPQSAAPPSAASPRPKQESEPLPPATMAPGDAAERSPRKRPTLAVDLSGLLLSSPADPGVPIALDLAILPRWTVNDRLSLRGLAAIPLLSPSVIAAEGRATVSEWMVGGFAEWSLMPRSSPWSVNLGAGAAAALIETQGAASPPNQTSSGSAWTAVPFAVASASDAIGSWGVRLGVEVLAGATTSPIIIRFAGRDAASWGTTILGFSFGLELALH